MKDQMSLMEWIPWGADKEKEVEGSIRGFVVVVEEEAVEAGMVAVTGRSVSVLNYFYACFSRLPKLNVFYILKQFVWTGFLYLLLHSGKCNTFLGNCFYILCLCIYMYIYIYLLYTCVNLCSYLFDWLSLCHSWHSFSRWRCLFWDFFQRWSEEKSCGRWWYYTRP